jgi:hypothetical protein
LECVRDFSRADASKVHYSAAYLSGASALCIGSMRALKKRASFEWAAASNHHQTEEFDTVDIK